MFQPQKYFFVPPEEPATAQNAITFMALLLKAKDHEHIYGNCTKSEYATVKKVLEKLNPNLSVKNKFEHPLRITEDMYEQFLKQ